jgi:acyl carrier protein
LRADEPTVLTFLEGVYEQVKGVRRDLRREDRIAEDLGIDSIASLELVMELEEEFGVELADDGRLMEVATIGDLIDVVLALRAG